MSFIYHVSGLYITCMYIQNELLVITVLTCTVIIDIWRVVYGLLFLLSIRVVATWSH